MPFRLRCCLVFAFFCLPACLAAPPEPELDAARGAIVNGSRETGRPAVVVVFDRVGGGLCTGALIAPKVVLTAKHCVQRGGASGPSRPSEMIVGVGSHVNQLFETHAVASIETTPGVYTSGSRGLQGALVGIDVAVVTLSRPASPEPLPLRRDPPTDVVGKTVTLVGFGQTPAGDVGRKYTTTVRLEAMRGDLLLFNAGICSGDSGGPMFAPSGEIIGVASFGTGACGSGVNAHNALFNFVDMIDDAIRASGECVPEGIELCDGRDNDCDDEVDEGCTAAGAMCGSDDECETQLCAQTSAGIVCTERCDPSRPILGCPAGLFCERAGSSCEGYCVPGVPGALGVGDACEGDSDCASLRCEQSPFGPRSCREACKADAGTCLGGELCNAKLGECGACVPEAQAVSNEMRLLGEACTEKTDCSTGRCFEDGTTKYCTRTCTDDIDCGDSFHCRDSLCVRGRREGAGGLCKNNDDCSVDTVCAQRGETQWCANFCNDEVSCAEGFECTAAGEISLCAPNRALLGEECSLDADCITNLCGETGLCIRECGTQSPCPTGFECRRSDDGTAFCEIPVVRAARDSGCAVSAPGQGSAKLNWLFFALFALFFRPVLRLRRSTLPRSNKDLC